MTLFKTFPSRSLILGLAAFLHLLAVANPSDTPEQSPADEYVQLHFAFYVWPVTGFLGENAEVAGIPRLFYHSPEGIRRIPLARNATSPLMPYRGPLPIEFFDAIRVEIPPPDDAPPGTEPTIGYRTTPVTNLNIPKTWRQVLFILFPGQSDPEGNPRILPIRYDVERVRPNYVRIHNTTSENLIVQVDGDEHLLNANGILDFQPPNQSGHHSFRANFLGLTDDDQLRQRLTTRMVSIEGQSNLFLLYPMGQRRIRLIRVGGHEPPPTPTPVPPPEPPPNRRGTNRF